MSVCLGVTKGIAISSLGLYAGILTSGTILSYVIPLDVISKHLRPLVCKLGKAATSLGALSTGFFSLSFFGAPSHLKHPYLIYGALAAPVSAFYMWSVSRSCSKCHAKDSKAGEEQEKAQEDQNSQLSDSVVDLGEDAKLPSHHPPVKEGAKCPMGTTCTDPVKVSRCQSKIARHLTITTSLAIFGFLQSIIGVYGEP